MKMVKLTVIVMNQSDKQTTIIYVLEPNAAEFTILPHAIQTLVY